MSIMSKNTQVEINLRLKMLYNMIPNCLKLGDVGTDHGFLPIYAIDNNKCKSALASDLRQGPLNIAMKNIKESGLENQIETLLTPGLEGYNDKNCDVIVIAGMGGITICDILRDCLDSSLNFDYFPGNITFVLQPNTHENEVRKFLWDNSFVIQDEQAVKDGNHVYLGIKCVLSSKKEEYKQLDTYTGKIMNKRLSDNDFLYFNNLKVKYLNILKGLSKRKGNDIDDNNRILFIKELIIHIDNIIKGEND